MTVAFFVLEWILQHQLVPLFFPGGRLFVTPGAIRIRIRIRLFALLLACNLVPFIATITVLHRFADPAGDPAGEGQQRVGGVALVFFSPREHPGRPCDPSLLAHAVEHRADVVTGGESLNRQ